MPLSIAFLGYDTQQARTYFEQLAKENREQIASYNRDHGVMILTDGTTIKRVAREEQTHGLRFDQVIIADDRRAHILQKQERLLHILETCCCRSIVPEEYRWQWYDLDAPDTQKEETTGK